MGLLDDAIREHLELKRRHGADPDELAHAEQEALGPVRRERFASEEDEASAEGPLLGARAKGLAEPEHELGGDDSGFGEPEGDLALRNGEGRDDLSEAEYEEYYDEEYYDEEEGEWEEPFHGAVEDPRHGSAESLHEAERAPTSAHHERVPPESAPPSQASRPERPEAESEGEETVEYSVEDAMRSAPPDPRSADQSEARPSESEGEDMLEETPEFLQDAPEHDRLWFEQRPPRDFDFDG